MDTYPNMDIFFEIFTAPVKMAVLETAVNLKIADTLEQASDLNDIAGDLGIKTAPKGLGYFLDALTALGFARKQNGRYANTELGRHFLMTKSPVYMGDLVMNMKGMQHRNLSKMADIIRNGPPEVQPDQMLSNEKKWEMAVAHLAAYQRAGMAARAGDIVQALPEFQGARKILDLGCGPGLMGMEMVRRHPTASGVLMDLPGIIRFTEKEVAKEGMTDRMTLIAGDYNETDVGGDYDIIWASHNLYYAKAKVPFFKRLKAALAPGGVFVCLHEGMTNERTAPPVTVLSRLSLALEGQDVSFEKGELADAMAKAGFKRIHTDMLTLPAGKAELIIAREGSTHEV